MPRKPIAAAVVKASRNRSPNVCTRGSTHQNPTLSTSRMLIDCAPEYASPSRNACPK